MRLWPAATDNSAALGTSLRMLQVASVAGERLPADAVETGAFARAAAKVILHHV